jgi:hypothetical protein
MLAGYGQIPSTLAELGDFSCMTEIWVPDICTATAHWLFFVT